MKQYTSKDFHNPEKLTRQQVGDGYRLLLPEEVDGGVGGENGECETIHPGNHSWLPISPEAKNWTYRVPLTTPLPDGTVLTSNEYCWAEEEAPFKMLKAFSPSGFEPSGITSKPESWGDDSAQPAPQEAEKLKLYIAGSMSGHEDYNFPAFFRAAAYLRDQGYDPVNPAQLDIDAGYPLERLKQLNEAEFKEFLNGATKRDLDALQGCDGIVMLPGWENSRGANAEMAVAQWMHKRIGYLWSENGDGFNLTWEDEKKQPYNSDERAEWDVEQPSDVPETDFGNITFHPNDPKGAAGAKKCPMHLLPPVALEQIAWVMGLGAEKYKAWNFIKADVCASTYIGALLRHWSEFAKGVDIDPESGLPHLAHVAANCAIVLTAQQQGTLVDDRPKLSVRDYRCSPEAVSTNTEK